MSSADESCALQVAQHLLASEGTDWGIEIEDAAVGYVRLRMPVRADMTNGHGTAHGGILFALADTAFAYACNSRNQASVAGSASIIFLAPANIGDLLIAEAREQALAGRSGAYSVAVRRDDGTHIAQFQGQSRTIGGPVLPTDHRETSHG